MLKQNKPTEFQVENMFKNIKLFTHNDLDGIGCEIVAKLFYNNVDVTIVKNPSDASKKVREFIKNEEWKAYDFIFITDISVDEETAELIDKTIEHRVQLIDHHKTALYLNDYLWADVTVQSKHGIMTFNESGTSLFFDFLSSRLQYIKKESHYEAVKFFVEQIRKYDTWDWNSEELKKDSIYDSHPSKMLNDLFWILGREDFVELYLNRFYKLPRFSMYCGEWKEMFQEVESKILELEERKKQRYFESKSNQVFVSKYYEHTVGVVFSEQYTSELGNYLSKENPHYDFIMLIDASRNKVSLRTIHDHVDVSEVAKRKGGGGHQKAAGFEVSEATSSVLFHIGYGTESEYIQSELYDVLYKEYAEENVDGEGFLSKVKSLVKKLIK